MIDSFGRKIKYLRLSVTDLCSLRCVYCMPEAGIQKMEHSSILSVDELIEIAKAGTQIGVTKIRLTGGEPLVRRGIVDICRGISALPGVSELCLTTNAVSLDKLAQPLKDAGVTRLNISLDTLNSEKFRQITRVGTLEAVMAGLEKAKKAGFTDTKINCVLMGGVNDDEIADFVALTRDENIQIRFIELMPIGECSSWPRERFISGDTVLEKVPQLEEVGSSGVARVYQVPGYRGTVGLISPMSHKFCAECDRIRVTSDGKLKPCLHSQEEIPLRGLHGEELVATMAKAVGMKPQQHVMTETHHSDSLRGMNAIGG